MLSKKILVAVFVLVDELGTNILSVNVLVFVIVDAFCSNMSFLNGHVLAFDVGDAFCTNVLSKKILVAVLFLSMCSVPTCYLRCCCFWSR